MSTPQITQATKRREILAWRVVDALNYSDHKLAQYAESLSKALGPDRYGAVD